MKLCSACLLGINCNYKGESKPYEKLIEMFKKGELIPVCPEQLGGLPTPRNGARIQEGDGHSVLNGESKLITDNNEDVTEQYIKGANETLKICMQLEITDVIFKQGSPSCGAGYIQGGKDKRKKIPGIGVTAALLEKNGVTVITEEDLVNV